MEIEFAPKQNETESKRDYAFINLDGGSRNDFDDLVALHSRELLGLWPITRKISRNSWDKRQVIYGEKKKLAKTCSACRQMLGKLGKSVLGIRLFKIRLYCIMPFFSTSSAPVFIHKRFSFCHTNGIWWQTRVRRQPKKRFFLSSQRHLEVSTETETCDTHEFPRMSCTGTTATSCMIFLFDNLEIPALGFSW